MTRTIAALAFVAVLGGGACASEPPRPKQVAPTVTGKLGAPVQVSAVLAPGSARVTVVFLGRASGVSIEFAGLDGLRFTSPALPVSDAAFAAGDTTVLDVTYDAPPGESNIAVFVRGTFDGGASTKVANITVGTPSVAQRTRSLQSDRIDARGEPVHEVPALPNP